MIDVKQRGVPVRLPLEGGRSARKKIRWIFFSVSRAVAPDTVRCSLTDEVSEVKLFA